MYVGGVEGLREDREKRDESSFLGDLYVLATRERGSIEFPEKKALSIETPTKAMHKSSTCPLN